MTGGKNKKKAPAVLLLSLWLRGLTFILKSSCISGTTILVGTGTGLPSRCVGKYYIVRTPFINEIPLVTIERALRRGFSAKKADCGDPASEYSWSTKSSGKNGWSLDRCSPNPWATLVDMIQGRIILYVRRHRHLGQMLNSQEVRCKFNLSLVINMACLGRLDCKFQNKTERKQQRISEGQQNQ